MADDGRLQILARGLIEALKRDARQLEADGAPDLARLAAQLDALLAHVAAAPDAAGRRMLLAALDEVELFHRRVRASLDDTRTALEGAAQRRMARRAYGEAERFGAGSA